MNLLHAVDPDIQKFLDELNSKLPSQVSVPDVDGGREDYLMFALKHAGKPLTMARVEDVTIPGHDTKHQMPLRIYTPIINQQLPCLIYYHGGGWQRGDIACHDSICRHLAKFSGCIVVSVDWRLAPEYRFPAGIQDCLTAYQWVVYNASQYNIDNTRLAVGGDSAGGNMTAAMLQLLHGISIQQPIFQLLLYPALDLTCSSWSYREFAEGYFLTTQRVKYYIDCYINPGDDVKNPLISPTFQQDFSYLPRTHIVTAGHDPLRGEDEAYVEKLHNSQVDVSYQCYDGMIHAFLHMNHSVPAAYQALQEISTVLKQALIK